MFLIFLCSPWTCIVCRMELRVGGKYRLGRKIGSGSFGDIYLGEREISSVHVACPAYMLYPLVNLWTIALLFHCIPYICVSLLCLLIGLLHVRVGTVCWIHSLCWHHSANRHTMWRPNTQYGQSNCHCSVLTVYIYMYPVSLAPFFHLLVMSIPIQISFPHI